MQDHHLFQYLLRLGDTALINGHRLGEWCGHGPILEEDIALTNIALDLIGQARGFLTLAGKVENKNRDEDALAYHRDALEFRNFLLSEQPNGDFAQTLLRQFLLSAYQYFLFQDLSSSKDESLAALAAKSLKEVSYHLRHSEQWILRMGDGTTESRERIMNAMNQLWRFTGDLFEMDETDAVLIKSKIVPDLNTIKIKWEEKVKSVFTEATLEMPENVFMMKGSRSGGHTEHLGFILAEMQVLPRMYPDAKW